MIKYNKNFKYFVYALIILCIVFIIIWTYLIIYPWEESTSQDAFKNIIIPTFCALVWATIPLALDNSLSNEKLKIVLERLEWWRKNRCHNEKWKLIDWTKTDWYDKEYKFIFKNRWKSDKELIKIMKKDKYWKSKYMDVTHGREIEDEFYNNRIKDHFIY